jgi:hypothetical protein
MRVPKNRFVRLALGATFFLFVLQLLPLGRPGESPPVRTEPIWPSAEARALAVRACFDCHSNETKWPWYAHIAPISWLAVHNVDEGREHLNFSEWDRPQKEAHEASEELLEGEMPLAIYLPFHPEARLSDTEKKVLADALATVGATAHGPENH